MKFKQFDSIYVNDKITKITDKNQDRRHFILSTKDQQVLLAHTTTVKKYEHIQIWVESWKSYITIDQDLHLSSIKTIYSAFHYDRGEDPLTKIEIDEIKYMFKNEIENFESQDRNETIKEGTYIRFYHSLNNNKENEKNIKTFDDTVKQLW